MYKEGEEGINNIFTLVIAFFVHLFIAAIFIFIYQLSSKKNLEPIEEKKEIKIKIKTKTIDKKEIIKTKTIDKKEIVKTKPMEEKKLEIKNKNIENLYGSEINKLSENEKKYLIENFELIKRITFTILIDYTTKKLENLNEYENDNNLIEFYLFPDGTISNINFIKHAEQKIMNDITKEVIQLSFKKYPNPKEKTLIRFNIKFNLH